jgi:hypothetical protein
MAVPGDLDPRIARNRNERRKAAIDVEVGQNKGIGIPLVVLVAQQ